MKRVYTSMRVGSRQWAVLLAADSVYPDAILAGLASKAVGDGLPPSAHMCVVESLVTQGMLAHPASCGDHPLTKHCPLTITERGAYARLNFRGRPRTQP